MVMALEEGQAVRIAEAGGIERLIEIFGSATDTKLIRNVRIAHTHVVGNMPPSS